MLNPDAFIATGNVDHLTVYGKPLDRRNFVPLGEDAVPVIVTRLDELDAINRRAIAQVLYLQLGESRRVAQNSGWEGSNLARTAALGLLAAREDELAAACEVGQGGTPSNTEARQAIIRDLRPLCFRPPAAGPDSGQVGSNRTDGG